VSWIGGNCSSDMSGMPVSAVTSVGASANVIVAGLGERAGYPISFGAFLKYGLIVTLESLLIASLYIWLRYL
jgi:Na+/H+ antiporter NhaD/arsenite permease-like protein